MRSRIYVELAAVASVFVGSLWLLVPARAAADPTSSLPKGAVAHSALSYVKHGGKSRTLDLYLPKSDKPTPLVIWIPDQAGGACPALALVARGFAVADINYRPTTEAKFPAQIQDCKAAVKWLRAHAADYNLAPDRFGAWGTGSGGHLAALLGTSAGVKELEAGEENADVSAEVQAVCDSFHSDLPPASNDKKDKPKTNPATYAQKNAAPTLILKSDDGFLGPIGDSDVLDKALKKVSASVQVEKARASAGADPGAPENLKIVRAFFAKYLHADAPADDPPKKTPAKAP